MRLLRNCQDFYSAKNKSLPMLIMEEFALWSSSPLSKPDLLTPQLKIDAFKLVTKQNALPLTKLVFDSFKMLEEKHLFEEIVMCMIDKKQYKEVSVYATILNLPY